MGEAGAPGRSADPIVVEAAWVGEEGHGSSQDVFEELPAVVEVLEALVFAQRGQVAMGVAMGAEAHAVGGHLLYLVERKCGQGTSRKVVDPVDLLCLRPHSRGYQEHGGGQAVVHQGRERMFAHGSEAIVEGDGAKP